MDKWSDFIFTKKENQLRRDKLPRFVDKYDIFKELHEHIHNEKLNESSMDSRLSKLEIKINIQ